VSFVRENFASAKTAMPKSVFSAAFVQIGQIWHILRERIFFIAQF